MPKLYEALADAFLAEGVDTQFVLMGDGNMHWSTAFAKLPGVHTVHVRHEHVTVAAATAYNIATGKVAVASVTCGPGVTQLTTALPAAVRARLPMVVFAGESPINAKFYNQYIDQAPLVTATGAHYIAAHSVPRMMDYVREAFHVAKYERCPVVLGIPYDLQKVEHMANQPYETSAMYQPKVGRMQPDPELVAEAVARLAARRPRPRARDRAACAPLWAGTSPRSRRAGWPCVRPSAGRRECLRPPGTVRTWRCGRPRARSPSCAARYARRCNAPRLLSPAAPGRCTGCRTWR